MGAEPLEEAGEAAQQPWYAAGLRFECTQCGNCCRTHGEYAYIYLTGADIEALAGELSLTREEFRARHCDEDRGWTIVRTTEPACPFLSQDGRCTVYAARPMQCRTWPFWQENLEQARWQGSVQKTCPGIGKGMLYSAAEVEEIAQRNERWYAPE